MTKMYVRHQVADFKNWKTVYDQHDATRKQFGCTAASVFTNAENPNEVIAVHEWGNKEQALKFIQSPDLKQAMQKAGVVSAPEVSFAE